MRFRNRVIATAFTLTAGLFLCGRLRINDHEAVSHDGKAVVTMLYSSEKQAWVESVARDFEHLHPEIELHLSMMDSLQAVQAIVDGRMRPLVWSPSDSLAVSLLAQEWRARYKTDAFASDGTDAPQPMLLSPLVWVAWQDHVPLLKGEQAGPPSDEAETLSWKAIHQAIAAPQSKGLSGEGRFKLGHTDPGRSISGLQALLLMTLEYQGYPGQLDAADLQTPRYQTWLREIEDGAIGLDASSNRLLMDMLRYGPSRCNVAVVSEDVALSSLEALPPERAALLRVYYPRLTVWSDHPVVLLTTAPWNRDQLEGARTWIQYLVSRPAQEKAPALGFRPADPGVSLEASGGSPNPFQRMRALGFRTDVSSVSISLDGAQIKELLQAWRTLDSASRARTAPPATVSTTPP